MYNGAIANAFLSKYDIFINGRMEDFVLLKNTHDNISFLYEEDLYEFCTNENIDSSLSIYRKNNKSEPYYLKLGHERTIHLPYLFNFINVDFNRLTGVPDDTERAANYMVFAIFDTADDKEAKIAKDYVGYIYVQLWKKLQRSYERLPAIECDNTPQSESILRRVLRWIGYVKGDKSISANEKYEKVYKLDISKMKLHRMVRNASASYKRKLSSKDLDALNSINMVIVVNTSTHMGDVREGTVDRIGRCYSLKSARKRTEKED